MNPRLSGLVLAIPAALALSFPLRAAAHEGHAHAPPGETFEDGSRPGNFDGKKPEDVGSNMGRDRNNDVPRNGDQGQQPIPEPETYAMMLAGLGILVASVRRRRRTNEEAPTA